MTFLYLNSDKMGEGEAELGKKLMRTFLAKLANSSIKIDVIGCVNSAIYLTTKGSDVIDSLKKLEEKGAKIASCKTCLEYHNRQKELLIGEVGTMDKTLEVMAKADKTIRPN
jgi:selenium metabolism protein YedF